MLLTAFLQTTLATGEGAQNLYRAPCGIGRVGLFSLLTDSGRSGRYNNVPTLTAEIGRPPADAPYR